MDIEEEDVEEINESIEPKKVVRVGAVMMWITSSTYICKKMNTKFFERGGMDV